MKEPIYGGADDVITKLAKRIAAKEQNEQAKVESLIRRRSLRVIRGSSRCIRSKQVVRNKVGLYVYDGRCEITPATTTPFITKL